MTFERQICHQITAALLLWRGAAVALRSSKQTTVTVATRRAGDGKPVSISVPVVRRWAHKHRTQQGAVPIVRPSRTRLPLPTLREGHHAAPFNEAVSGRRAMSHWSALRSRLFPALKLAVLPATAACLAAAAGAQRPFQQQIITDSFGPRLPPVAPVPTPSSQLLEAAAPTDVTTARQLLESRGFVHPGMQPGAAWGAIPASSSGEVPTMFEYLLLFPA